MYLISAYFDETTEKKLCGYMAQVAKRTGNDAMIAGNIPPHITITAFQAEDEEQARNIFRRAAAQMTAGTLQWVSVGSFLPQVLYVVPVLNEYLHGLSVITYKEALKQTTIEISPYYRPFQWLPHTTIGKRLTEAQLKTAFETMQNQFGPFRGSINRIGLSKTNPYTELENLVLK